MSEVVSRRRSVMAIICQFVTRRMPQHMRVDRKGHLRRLASALDHPQEPRRCHWRPGFSHEHIRAHALQRT